MAWHLKRRCCFGTGVCAQGASRASAYCRSGIRVHETLLCTIEPKTSTPIRTPHNNRTTVCWDVISVWREGVTAWQESARTSPMLSTCGCTSVTERKSVVVRHQTQETSNSEQGAPRICFPVCERRRIAQNNSPSGVVP
eukprot:1138334-Rhodomonas_salina.3